MPTYTLKQQQTLEIVRDMLIDRGLARRRCLLDQGGVSAETPVYLTGQDAKHLQPHLTRAVRTHPGLGILGVALAVRAKPPR